ncbi:MAG: HD domain-containing protein [Bacteroidota bacterium]
MKETQQNPRYHAEGNVYNHTLLVLEKFHAHAYEFDLTDEERTILYWACILHDTGKPEVTHLKNGRWVSTGHEEAGVPIARDILLQHPEISESQRERILDLVKWHFVPLRWGLKRVDLQEYQQLSTQTNLRLLGIFAYFDILGRLCERKPVVLAMIRHFNEYIVPTVLQES